MQRRKGWLPRTREAVAMRTNGPHAHAHARRDGWGSRSPGSDPASTWDHARPRSGKILHASYLTHAIVHAVMPAPPASRPHLDRVSTAVGQSETRQRLLLYMRRRFPRLLVDGRSASLAMPQAPPPRTRQLSMSQSRAGGITTQRRRVHLRIYLRIFTSTKIGPRPSLAELQ